ncbi:MAG: Phosphoserine aminotransferase, partial [uncultured Frankineae bacterium]
DDSPARPDPRRPAARRRPLRLRALEGPAGAARGARGHRPRLPRHVPPAEAGAVPGRPAACRPARAVLAARRLRGGPRQRRGDAVLGHRDLRPDRPQELPPVVRGVQREVRGRGRRSALPRRAVGRHERAGHPPAPGRGGGGRPLRPHPQRDLDRRRDADRPGRGRRRRRAGGRRRHERGRRPPGRPGAVRRLLLLPAEELRLRRRAVAGADVARRSRARRRREGRRALGPGVVRPDRGRREQPARPDLQHALARDDLPDGRAGRLDERLRRPGLGGRAHPRLERGAVRLGRHEPVRLAVRAGAGHALAGRRDDRPRRLGRRRGRRGGPAPERRGRHRALPQARPQPAADRHVPRRGPVGRAGAHRLHRPRRGEPVL